MPFNRHSFLIPLLLIGMSCCLIPSSFARVVSWSIARYERELNTLSLLVEQVETRKELKQLEAAIQAFPDEVEITYSVSNDESAKQEVSMGWLRDYFEHNPALFEEDSLNRDPALQNLSRILELRAEEMQELNRLDIDKQEVRNNRNRILSDRLYEWKAEKEEPEEIEIPEFKPKKERETPEWLVGFELFLKDYGVYILWALLAVFILFIIYLVVRKLDFSKNEQVIDIGEGDGLLKEDDPRDSDTMKKVASKATGQQKYNAALRYYYLALILMLHEDEIIPYKSSLTNWEYYRKMLALGFPKDLIHGITRDFDDTQYGHKQIPLEEFRDFQKQVQSLYAYVSNLTEKA